MLLHTDYFFHILDKTAQLCVRNVSLYREVHIYFSKSKKKKSMKSSGNIGFHRQII